MHVLAGNCEHCGPSEIPTMIDSSVQQKLFLTICISIFVCSLLTSCQQASERLDKARHRIEVAHEAVMKDEEKQQQAATKPAPRRISALGRVQPETDIRKVAVPGAVSGDRIEDILVKENEYVKKGQPLARLNSYESLKAAYDEAAEQVEVAQSKLDQVKAGAKKGEIKAQEYKIESLKRQLAAERKAQDEKVARCTFQKEEAKRQYDRYKQLLADGAVSASEVDRYLVNFQTADKNLGEAVETRTGKLRVLDSQIDEAIQTRDKIAEVRPVDVKVAESELKKAEAARNRAKTELGFATVLSPQDGQILAITARPGDRATVEGILDMADTNNMIVVAEVYQTDAPHIFIGQKATITADGFPKSAEVVVYQIGSQITKQKIFADQAGSNQDLRVVEVKLRPKKEDIERGLKHASNLQVNVVFEPETEAQKKADGAH